MFTVIEKVENLKAASSRYNLMTAIDKELKHDKVFTLYIHQCAKSRNKAVQCDIIGGDGIPVASFNSAMCSFGDALRNIHRQIKLYKSNNHIGGNNEYSVKR